MKSHVYLNPMTPDGKPGEVVEIEVSDEAPQYLEPYAENLAEGDTSSQTLGKLRKAVVDAQSKLHHAKSRGKGVAEAQKALEAARAAAGRAHYDQQQQRQRHQTGGDSPFGPRPTGDTRMFMPVRDYSAESDDGAESPSEELSEEQLTAKILAAVAAIETAQSDGAPWSEILRLEAALKDLRDQLDNPSAPPKDTTSAPPRRSHIERPAPPQGRAGQAAVKKKFFAAIDASQAKRRKARSATQSEKKICCQGAYLCAECRKKVAAV